MRSLINRATEYFDKNVEVERLTPNEVNEFLAENRWTLNEITTGSCYDEESYANYINNAYPNVVLTMKWNGWTGQVELVATHIEKDNTLAEELRESLEIVLADKYAVVEHRDYDFFDVDKFFESQGWELYRATCIFQPGWCHYIYGHDNYPDIRLVLAWKVGHQIAALWTMDSDLIGDEPNYEEYNL